MSYRTLMATACTTAALSLGVTAPVQAAGPNFAGNVIIDGSLCVGFDCVIGMGFGFDTIVMQENNLRLFFNDTSSSASFPPNDWRLTANDSTNGGDSHFSIEDASAGRFVFRVFAGARSNALVVDSQGDLGLGTSTPAVDIDIKTGNTPTVRLQQDGTSGFNPQTWDMAGNEANFFIRDATNGSKLPLRIFPNAPSNSLSIEGTTGDIGLGTTSPTAPLHIVRNGQVFMSLENSSVTAGNNTGRIWNVQNVGGEFRVTTAPGGAGEVELAMNVDGDLTLSGTLTTTGGATCSVTPCDAVFDPALYTVPSIDDHAAVMWQNKYLPAVGPTGADQAINVSDKLLRMLNELEHAHIYIEQLNKRIEVLEGRIVKNDG